MISILDYIFSIWYYWMFVSVGFAIIGFVCSGQFLNKSLKLKYSYIRIVLISQLFVSAIIGSTISYIVKESARQEIKDFLYSTDLVVLVNEKSINQEFKQSVVSELKKIRNIPGHHSHPTGEIEIILESGINKIVLSLRQDSEFEDEYWIYLNKYKITSNNEVGRINTSILDNKNGA